MKELIDYIARGLVDDPDSVDVTTHQDGDTLVVELEVDEDDLGKVIGKKGRTAKAMRTVLSAAAALHGKRAALDIIE